MKALVVYDSVYGNTKLVAEEIAARLGKGVRFLCVDEVKEKDLAGLDLLVVGSPILGWRPSEKTAAFLSSLKTGQLKGMKVAAFDTRMRIFFHGDAARKIAAALQKAGGSLIGEPTGFIVEGTKGPLDCHALKNAAKWAETLK